MHAKEVDEVRVKMLANYSIQCKTDIRVCLEIGSERTNIVTAPKTQTSDKPAAPARLLP